MLIVRVILEWFFIEWNGFSVCRVDGDPDMVRLYRHLLNGYVQDIRPSKNHSLPLNITFGFSLTQIIDVVLYLSLYLLMYSQYEH